MEIMQLLTFIGGSMVAIISYFLRRTMKELEDIKITAYETKSKVQVLENDYLNKIDALNQRISMLYNGIEKLTEKIDELNKSIR